MHILVRRNYLREIWLYDASDIDFSSKILSGFSRGLSIDSRGMEKFLTFHRRFENRVAFVTSIYYSPDAREFSCFASAAGGASQQHSEGIKNVDERHGVQHRKALHGNSGSSRWRRMTEAGHRQTGRKGSRRRRWRRFVTWLGRQTDLSFRLHGGLLGGRGVHYSSLIRGEKSEANWKTEVCGWTSEAGHVGRCRTAPRPGRKRWRAGAASKKERDASLTRDPPYMIKKRRRALR